MNFFLLLNTKEDHLKLTKQLMDPIDFHSMGEKNTRVHQLLGYRFGYYTGLEQHESEFRIV